jgi:DnaJ-class molecular chaperone
VTATALTDRLPMMSACLKCGGAMHYLSLPRTDTPRCHRCEGRGTTRQYNSPNSIHEDAWPCENCSGSGHEPEEKWTCQECGEVWTYAPRFEVKT